MFTFEERATCVLPTDSTAVATEGKATLDKKRLDMVKTAVYAKFKIPASKREDYWNLTLRQVAASKLSHAMKKKREGFTSDKKKQ